MVIDEATDLAQESRGEPLSTGMRAALPLAVPAVPIGILLGVAIRDSELVNNLAGWMSSLMLLAGASQFAAIEMLDEGAGVLAVVAAIFMINARHLMYSAAMSPRFKQAPTWFKIVGSHLLIDQAFALNGDHAPGGLQERSLHYQMWFFLGTAIPMMMVWVAAVGAGVYLGELIPAEWEVDFAIPLMFLGLMVMSTSNIPGVVAATIGGTVAVVARDWPSGSGLLTGAVLGVLVAGVLDALLERRGNSGRNGHGTINEEKELAPGVIGPGAGKGAAV